MEEKMRGCLNWLLIGFLWIVAIIVLIVCFG